VTEERALTELFHDVLDRQEVSGPFQRLQIELEKPGAARSRRGRRIFMTRNRLVLLAAAMVMILIAGLLVGARLYHDYQNSAQVPAGHAGQATVAQLLARPLQFKQLGAGERCPQNGPFIGSLSGAGPLYLGGGSDYTDTNWGHYNTSDFIITPPGLVGPVVVRAVNLRNSQPLVFLGPYGTGPLYGTDTVGGKSVNQFAAMAFDTDHPPTTMYDFPTPYLQWPVEDGWPHTQTGFCVGIQIDGPNFTEVIHDQVDPS
jgi:hypothetical protein